jgi:hypothetical protein
MQSLSHTLDRVEVTFDDDHAVAEAGLILPATLTGNLDIEQAADELIGVGYRPGRKVTTLVHAVLAGAECIDDVDILRSGATERIVGHKVMSPSTLGTWLRSFTFGHVRQLDKLAQTIMSRAWAAGAGPADEPMTIDLDSTICEVHGRDKQGAAYGYTRVLGYHPILATRADTGEVLHTRMRKGSANTMRGAAWFVRETVARVRQAGATGALTLRADSGFYSANVITACTDHDVRYSITTRNTRPVVAAIESIDEAAWADIDYTEGGAAQVAEGTLEGRRLIVRRTRLLGKQAQLWPHWRHHAFVTNRPGDAVSLDADHRHHATQELAIRDLKYGAGLAHCPSGNFQANAAWLVLVTLAHNLLRWAAHLGAITDGPIVAKTIRRRFLSVPARLTRSARVHTLHLPTRWPWAEAFLTALRQLRAIPARC